MKPLSLFLLLATSPAPLVSQVAVDASAHIRFAEHRILDAGMLVPASGTLLGASLGVALGDRFQIRGEALGGRFTTGDAPSIDDHDVAEVQLLGSVMVRPWLRIEGGPVLRSFSGPLARQHWTMVQIGGAARVPLGFENVRGVLRGSWIPVVAVSGLSRPDIALTMATGVEWQGRRVGASALYRLERYDFAPTGGARRLEELSSLEIRITVRSKG